MAPNDDVFTSQAHPPTRTKNTSIIQTHANYVFEADIPDEPTNPVDKKEKEKRKKEKPNL